MILQSLVKYYEALERKGEVTRKGWCRAKVSYALSINQQGELLRVISLKENKEQGKKKVETPQNLEVPQMLTRSSGIMPNFLCDNSSYLLGIDSKGKPERSEKCFRAARARHLGVLKDVDSTAALAVKNYFNSWKPENAWENTALSGDLEEIIKGENLIFALDGSYVQEDPVIKEKWEEESAQVEEEEGICLVTGKRTEIARIHGGIKGIPGAQSSGALLVSFNAPAFESYGKEQSFNAPVGTYAVYAYTTALNSLIADKDHRTQIGDTMVVYWAEDGAPSYQNVFAHLSEPTVDNQEIVKGVFQNLEAGKAVVADDVLGSLSMDQKFYVLGLSPNAARIAVRFFYQDSFGNILKHIKAHYDRMKIIKPVNDKIEYLGIWRMLQETVNKKSKDKKPASNMAGAVYRAIISGERYPTSLYQAVLGRIHAEQDDGDKRIYKITRGRAAILKAFLMRNGGANQEEITMALNETSKNTAYTLGREFAVLEMIQRDANPGINATIKDRYFNSACATPAMIFPILFKLKNSHIQKIKNIGQRKYFEKLLKELQDILEVSDGQQSACPARLSLEEQGMFILGYYHQTQKNYEKKTEEDK